MLSRFFLNNSNKKMLAPHAVDISVTISSLIVYYVSHLPNHSTTFFSSSSQVVHWSAEIQTKVYDPTKDRPTDRPTKRVNSPSLLNSCFAFCKIVVKRTHQISIILVHCIECLSTFSLSLRKHGKIGMFPFIFSVQVRTLKTA